MPRTLLAAIVAVAVATIVVPIVALAATTPTPSITGTQGTGNWYRSNVSLSWATATQTVVSGCATATITADQGLTTYNCTVSDGTATASATAIIGRDTVKPGISGSILSGTLGLNNWYTSSVVVHFSCSDTLSGIATGGCPTDQTLSSDGSGQYSGTPTASDNAGNVSNPAVPVGPFNIDKTAPTATLSVTAGTAGLNGWYTTDVTVTTTGTDATSGIASCTADQSQTTETTGQTFNGSCTDEAGLTGNATALVVKLDETDPTLSPTLSKTTIQIGDSATAAPNATDAVSGIASASCEPVDTTTIGAHSLTCTATDRAGNSASTTVDYQVGGAATIIYGTKPPLSGGFGTFAFGGGSLQELLSASGCPSSTAVFFFNKPDGTFATWIPGSQVAVVNQEFLGLFSGSPQVPTGTIMIGKCV